MRDLHRPNSKLSAFSGNTTSSLRAFRSRSGFTLLELIVVIMLMSLILGLSTVYFAHFLPSNKFKATTREVASAFRQARALAQIHGQKQILTFDLEQKEYGIEGKKYKTIPQDISIKIIDPIFGEVTEGKYQYIMQPLGTEGGKVMLWDEKREASIQLDPVAGSLIIQ